MRLRIPGAAKRSAVRLLAAFALWFFVGPLAFAETRVALVIGESAYEALPALPNPVNDAEDLAGALKSLGFATTLKTNVSGEALKKAVAEFGALAAKADVSLLYYGGHGVQLGGANFLIPIDARIRAVDDIPKAAVAFDDVLTAIGKGSGERLVFLDACRNDPFPTDGPQLPNKGLAEAGQRSGFLMVYSTQPDAVAFDGAGRNSPFAAGLLSHIATPGADVSSTMIEVRRDVIGATGGQQVPWEHSSMTRQFYFAGESQAGASPETLMWRLAAAGRDPKLLQIYLDKYPAGPHASDARALIAESGPAPSAPAAQPKLEDDLWSLALGARSQELGELYLARFPKGAHADDARRLLDSLQASAAASTDPTLQCARLATDPKDRNALAPGVEIDELAKHADAAIAACSAAAAAHPETPHYVALLARAYWAAGRYPDSFDAYRKAAGAGDGRAMFSLAYRLEQGIQTPKDQKAAIDLYRRAADAGLADAQVNLAADIYDGKTGAKNAEEAYVWMKKAADQGSPRGTLDLGKMIEAGIGDKTLDPLEFYRRAASFGEPRGYIEAARVLEKRKDYAGAATQWLRCVAANDLDCVGPLIGAKQGASAAIVKAIQAQLAAGGYYSGPVDGRTGPGLKDALKQVELLGPPKV